MFARIAFFAAVALLTLPPLAAQAANTADLGLRVTAVSFRNGVTGTYTISVANAGPSATNDTITIKVNLPAGITFLSGGGSSFSCSAAGQVVTCVRTTAMSPGTVSFQFRTNICTTATRVSTTATISYAGDNNSASDYTSRGTSVKQGACVALPTPTRTATPAATSAASTPTRTATATATTSATGAATDVSVGMSAVGAFRVGGVGTYFLFATNHGSVATSAPLTITDALPAGLTFESASGAGWVCSAIGQNVTCSFAGSLAAQTNTAFSMYVRVARAAAPTVSNTAILNYAGDTDATNNIARRPTTVRF